MTALSVYPAPKVEAPKIARTVEPPAPLSAPVRPGAPVDVQQDAALARAFLASLAADPVEAWLSHRKVARPAPAPHIVVGRKEAERAIRIADAIEGRASFAGLGEALRSGVERGDLIRRYLPQFEDDEQIVKAHVDGTLRPLLSRARERAEYDNAVGRAVACEKRKAMSAHARHWASRLDRWDGRSSLSIPDCEFDERATEGAIRGQSIDLDALESLEEETKAELAKATDSFNGQLRRWKGRF